MTASSWNVLREGGASGGTVLMLPFAGGGANSFYPWLPYLPTAPTVLAADYPGRGTRIGQPPSTSPAHLADTLAGEALDRVSGPVAVLGHSLGALLGFEVAWRLQEAGRDLTVFVASASAAPQLQPVPPALHELDDEQLLGELNARGDLPAEILAEPQLVALLLPALRADLAAGHAYRYGAADRRLRCPVTALGGSADPAVPVPALRAWQAVAGDTFRIQVFTGGHFYFRNQLPDVATAVTAALGAGIAGLRTI
ncbi:thioesterase II family protein [Actinoplanes philippinensis]|uniref:thioesterase II family protein n=1 Tax=Actinoplanes philippinensis TaxID=35752 RepID=UPI0033E5EDC3